jgi:hypothetical protein
VDWLYSSLGDSNPLLYQDATLNLENAPPDISIKAPSLDLDVNTTIMARDNVDQDVEGLQLDREEFFGYLELLQNSPPTTLSNTQQLIGLVKRMLDDANNLDIMDYDFTLGLGALETSLKRKKRFFIPKKKNKRSNRSGRLEIDSTYENEPFHFPHLNKQGHPHVNNASSIVLGDFCRVVISIC